MPSLKILTKVLNLKTFTLDDDEFATLKAFENDDPDNREFVYEFRYTLNTVQAVKKKIKGVCISILPQLPKAPPNIFAQPTQQLAPNPLKAAKAASFIAQVAPIKKKIPQLAMVQAQPVKAATLVANILAKPANIKAVKIANKNLAVKSKCSDATAKISNTLAAKLAVSPPKKANFLPNFKAAVIKPAKKLVLKQPFELKEQATPAPILQVNQLKATPLQASVNSPAKLSINSILKNDIDPTEMLKTKFVINTAKSLKGVIQAKPVLTKKNFAASLLAKTMLAQSNVTQIDDVDEGAFVPFLIKEDQPNVAVTAKVNVREEDIEGDAFYVKFELLNNEDITIEQTIKKVKHGHLVKLFFTPTIPPRVVPSSFKKVGQNFLEITQVDPTATSVRIYRKVISRTQQFSTFTYQLVQELDIDANDGTQKFIDFTNNTSRIIYRVIPVGPTGIQGFEFSNVVSKPVRFRGTKKDDRHVFSVVVAKPSGAGIDVEVSNITPGPVALKVMRRDLTLHEKDFGTVIDFAANKEKSVLLNDLDSTLIFSDTDVKPSHVYEYCAVVIFADGDEEFTTGCDTIEFIPFSVGTTTTNTSTPEVLNTLDGIDIKFKVKSIINEKALDKVKKLLEAQGLADLFEQQLLDEKDKLADLIAHKIERVNLTTGEREQFVTITDEEFSDAANRDISSVSPLQAGHTYSYLISTLLRAPETLFKEFEKQAQDPVLNKPYAFKPAKFLHPITLNKGNIVTEASLKSNHAKGDFEFGNIGNLHTVRVNLKDIAPEISNAQVKNIGDNKNVVSWSVSGDKNSIDHFVVIQKRMRMEEIVGKAHAITDSEVIEFTDILDEDETGEMLYKIIPVFNTYRRGPAVSTDEIVI